MKRLIPKNHSINIMMWRDENYKNLYEWKEYERGMSAMETGAGSLTQAFKTVKHGLKTGYTHFVLSYPEAMSGGPTKNNPHSLVFRSDIKIKKRK